MKCKQCGVIGVEHFYKKSDRQGAQRYHSLCKKCKNQQTIASRRKRKGNWIKKLNLVLKCEVCGYDRCGSAIEFHHLDPSSKKDEIAQLLRKPVKDKWEQRLKDELTKCQMVCSNCHRELHFLHG